VYVCVFVDIGAAFGTTAASPLIHIAGITPEATNPSHIADMMNLASDRRQTITAVALDETFRLLDQQEKTTTKEVVGKEAEDHGDNDDSHNSIEWVALGNPHLSLSECDEFLRLLENDVPAGMRKHKDVSVMAW
jgi:predicted aconitase